MVDQYATRFMELSHFTNYLILDKENKAKMFERGLDRKIRERICAFRISNFFELVTRATIVEEDI